MIILTRPREIHLGSREKWPLVEVRLYKLTMKFRARIKREFVARDIT